MRGSNMKKREIIRLNRRRQAPVLPPSPTIEPVAPEPEEKRGRGLGLRKSLERQYGPNLSISQKELIDFYVHLNDMKNGDLKDRDTFNILSMQRQILRQLDSTKGPGFSPNGEGSRFASMSDKELDDELRELDDLRPRMPGFEGSVEQELEAVNKRLDGHKPRVLRLTD